MNYWAILVFFLPIYARLSHEEKIRLRRASELADKSIQFKEFHEIKSAIEDATTALVFFGANWCHNTHRFTPKYLEVQQRVNKAKLQEKGFTTFKIECAVDHEQFCISRYHIDGFPTLLTFVNGELKEEYPHEDEVEPLMNYIENLVKENPKSANPKPKFDSNHEPAEQKGKVEEPKQVEVPKSHAKIVYEEEEDAEDEIILSPALEVKADEVSVWPYVLVVGVVVGGLFAYISRSKRGKYRQVSRVLDD
ncbi:hypothetical protein BC833DRAFT_610751 [Globomyces pollinis-pini]|nr:hypothetical protein BC833DRAFT_610751 [Globomyces pollinis-pini]